MGRWLMMFGVVAGLSACGWQLRGMSSGQYPAQLQLASPDRYAPLIASLGQAMSQRQVASADDAPLRLEVEPEQLTKRTVAVTAIGSTAQYELSQSAAWRLYQRNGQNQTLLREGLPKAAACLTSSPAIT